MKRFLTIVLMLLALTPVIKSQEMRKATPEEARAMIAKINKSAASISTITCSFTQEKSIAMLKDKMISQGKMCYSSAGKLRWEYSSPYSYILVINNNKVSMKSGSKTNTVDINSSKLFQAVARIMVSSVTGKSLNKSNDFDITMYSSNKNWCAQLVPKEANMKKMFKFIRLYFNSNQTMVSRVEMIEKNGDKTIIRLNNVVTNKQIADAQFRVN